VDGRVPAGAVQIREEMQSGGQDVGERSGATALFVTHDVREAAVLGDRIVVLSHRPGMVSQILENHAPRPRTLKDPAVEEVIRRSNEILKAEVQWSNNQTKLLL